MQSDFCGFLETVGFRQEICVIFVHGCREAPGRNCRRCSTFANLMGNLILFLLPSNSFGVLNLECFSLALEKKGWLEVVPLPSLVLSHAVLDLAGINSSVELLHSPRQIVSSVGICPFLVVPQQKKVLQRSSKNDNRFTVRVTLTAAYWTFKMNYLSVDSWQAQAGRDLSWILGAHSRLAVAWSGQSPCLLWALPSTKHSATLRGTQTLSILLKYIK